MQEKLKRNSTFVLDLLKSAFVGVIASILLVLLFAFVLKFIDLNDGIISFINEVIKVVSIMIAVLSLIKKSPYKILLKSVLVGVVYRVFAFILFSALRGSYSFGASILIDIALAGLTGAIFAVILNVFKKDKVVA